MSQFQIKNFLSANMLLYSSGEFNSEVLSVFLCSGKYWEAFVWDKVPGFLMQVSRCLGKTLHEPDSQNPPSPWQGRRIKNAALTLEEEGKVGFRKIVLLRKKSVVRDSLKINGRKDSFNFSMKYGV